MTSHRQWTPGAPDRVPSHRRPPGAPDPRWAHPRQQEPTQSGSPGSAFRQGMPREPAAATSRTAHSEDGGRHGHRCAWAISQPQQTTGSRRTPAIASDGDVDGHRRTPVAGRRHHLGPAPESTHHQHSPAMTGRSPPTHHPQAPQTAPSLPPGCNWPAPASTMTWPCRSDGR